MNRHPKNGDHFFQSLLFREFSVTMDFVRDGSERKNPGGGRF